MLGGPDFQAAELVARIFELKANGQVILPSHYSIVVYELLKHKVSQRGSLTQDEVSMRGKPRKQEGEAVQQIKNQIPSHSAFLKTKHRLKNRSYVY